MQIKVLNMCKNNPRKWNPTPNIYILYIKPMWKSVFIFIWHLNVILFAKIIYCNAIYYLHQHKHRSTKFWLDEIQKELLNCAFLPRLNILIKKDIKKWNVVPWDFNSSRSHFLWSKAGWADCDLVFINGWVITAWSVCVCMI